MAIERVTITLPAELVEGIDRFERNRSRFIATAVEHDMTFVRQIAHQVTVLHFGELFAQGSIDQIEANDAVAEIYLGTSNAN